MYLVDGLAYNQAQNNSLNWHWSNLYHRCCSYLMFMSYVCAYAILRIIDILCRFFSRESAVNIAQKNFGNILKYFLLQVSDEEVTKLVSNSLQSMRNIFPEFDQFSFTPRTIPDSDSGEPHANFIFHFEYLQIVSTRN